MATFYFKKALLIQDSFARCFVLFRRYLREGRSSLSACC
nr:MAG TPA: hypothetical protein [Caudoviricetes sp.]